MESSHKGRLNADMLRMTRVLRLSNEVFVKPLSTSFVLFPSPFL